QASPGLRPLGAYRELAPLAPGEATSEAAREWQVSWLRRFRSQLEDCPSGAGVQLGNACLAAELLQPQQDEHPLCEARQWSAGLPKLPGIGCELVLALDAGDLPVDLGALDRIGDIAFGDQDRQAERDPRRPYIEVRLLALAERIHRPLQHGLEQVE